MEDTFEGFVGEHLDRLFRFAVTLTDDRGLGEDIVQEVLIRVHRKWEEIGSLAQRDAYVRRMVVNEFLSWRRRWARIVPVADVEVIREAHSDFAADSAQRDGLRTELAKLPRRQLTAIVLRFYSGLTDAEIAEAMGCRAVTVRGYTSRGLRALRIELENTDKSERLSEAMTPEWEGR